MRFVTRILEALRAPGAHVESRVPATQLPLNLLDPAFLADPYAVYARLRLEDPVHRLKSGGYLITRHADITAALANPALGNAPSRRSPLAPRNRGRSVAADVAANILPFRDKPLHTASRKFVSGVFRSWMKSYPLDASAVSRGLLGPLLETGAMEAMVDFGRPLSLRIMCGLMGLPPEDGMRLLAWSDAFFYLFAPMPSEAVRQETDASLGAFRHYLMPLVRARRSRPGGDLVSHLVAAREDGHALSDEEIADTLMLLFADGVENIDAAIANTLLALHRYPAQMRLLHAEPARAGRVAVEGLRFDSPAQIIARVAREDIRIAGTNVAADGAVFLALGAANRDPARFSAPDVFDMHRPETDALTFGKGRHSCLGVALVRIELEAALFELFSATSRIEVDDSALAWEPRLGHRWLERLPVRLIAR